MSPLDAGTVTALLDRWHKGEPAALDKLMPILYRELRRLAQAYLRREQSGTIESTALVNEAYLRLVGSAPVECDNRAEFLGLAASVMRHILVDRARARHAAKRGSGAPLLQLEAAAGLTQKRPIDLVALDDLLISLSKIDPRQSRIVELRFFAGLTVEEVAEVLQVPPAIVKREWVFAKTWLYRHLAHSENSAHSK